MYDFCLRKRQGYVIIEKNSGVLYMKKLTALMLSCMLLFGSCNVAIEGLLGGSGSDESSSMGYVSSYIESFESSEPESSVPENEPEEGEGNQPEENQPEENQPEENPEDKPEDTPEEEKPKEEEPEEELPEDVPGDPECEHDYETAVVQPTCTKEGYTIYTCSDCGASYVSDKVPYLGHAYGSVVTKPTCTTNGYTTYTCADCGDTVCTDAT